MKDSEAFRPTMKDEWPFDLVTSDDLRTKGYEGFGTKGYEGHFEVSRHNTCNFIGFFHLNRLSLTDEVNDSKWSITLL